MYFILPETEGRSLEEIELHFSDNSKKITNRRIPKTQIVQENSKQSNFDAENVLNVYKTNEKTTKVNTSSDNETCLNNI